MKTENIKIILSRIWSPGNVGSIIRAMKNFDLTDIVSVDQMNFDEEETLTMCAGAKDHLENLRYSSDLKKEVISLNSVYAFTARKRKFYKIITPEQMADEIYELPDSAKVGLMFGNETNGLTNDETDLCDKLVLIPASQNYSSLNVSSAAMIAMYEIKKRSLKPSFPEKEDLVSIKIRESLFETVENIVENKLMEKSDNKKQIRENLRHIFRRMNLNKKEAGFIRSIFEIVDRKIN